MTSGPSAAGLYLSELLQHRTEVFALSLTAGGGGAALLQLRLQLQQPPHVEGLFGGRLLQQSLLVGLPILSHFPLDGVGLAERLTETTEIESFTLWANKNESRILEKYNLKCEISSKHL